MIQRTLDFLLSFNEIKEITLCVEGKSDPAIHAYRRAGFTLKHKLAFFMAEERDWRSSLDVREFFSKKNQAFVKLLDKGCSILFLLS